MPGKLSDEEKTSLENDAKEAQAAKEEVKKKESELEEVDEMIAHEREKQQEMQEDKARIAENYRKGAIDKDQYVRALKDRDDIEVQSIKDEKDLMKERESRARELAQAKWNAEHGTQKDKDQDKEQECTR